MKGREIILASASPRREELLRLMGLEFRIVPSHIEEVIEDKTPEETVKALSYQKAEDVAGRLEEDALVIGSDTIVVCDNKIMGKPRDEEDAFAMLSRLQGRTHEVYTGVTVLERVQGGARRDTFARKALVRVHSMEEREIRDYIAKGESLDKAGAYGIQGSFAVFVDAIEGEYGTILGLPIAALYQTLKKYD